MNLEFINVYMVFKGLGYMRFFGGGVRIEERWVVRIEFWVL